MRKRAEPQVDPITQFDYNEGIESFKAGDYLKAWPRWDLRYGYAKIGYPTSTNIQNNLWNPYWQGEATEGLIVVDDQGYGDAIQFLRYIPLLYQYCKNIEVACKPGLNELIQDSFPKVRLIDFRRESTGDMWFYGTATYPYYLLTSLGRIFQTTIDTIPNTMPYLKAGSVKFDRPTIGVCWTTDVTWADNYSDKTIPKEIILPLLQEYNCISLQKEHLDVRNWSDTAAIINGLDLVISGDFGIAHLAGALGKPLWMMLQHDPDWRWCTGGRSPWYPTASLYRQDCPGDWNSVLEKIYHRLERLPYHFRQNHHNLCTEDHQWFEYQVHDCVHK